jgi:hypothetical protein
MVKKEEEVVAPSFGRVKNNLRMGIVPFSNSGWAAKRRKVQFI